MAEPFKNMFNEQFFDLFTKDLKLVINDFDAREFVSQVMDDEWEGRELKQRCMHITTVLRKFLPADYKEAIAKILELLDHIKKTRPDFSVIDDTKFGLTLEYGGILDNYVEIWAGRLRNFCQGDRENHAVHKLRVCGSFFYYQISGSDDETDVGLVETRTLGSQAACVRRLSSASSLGDGVAEPERESCAYHSYSGKSKK